MQALTFLPISADDMKERGWDHYDFLLVTGDAYVDHPSFGAAVISRVLEAEGFRTAILSQPDWKSPADFAAMGRPRFGVFITAGNLDSMVAHYTAAKKTRREDLYSPGGEPGKRPDRACIAYTGRAREAFPGLPVVLGGLEASLRRFTHYDYWDGKLRRPMLFDSKADLLIFGMGERPTAAVAHALASGDIAAARAERGVCFIAKDESECRFPLVRLPSHKEQLEDRAAHARAVMTEYREHDHIRGRALSAECDGRYMIQNPPAIPLCERELDRSAELPYTRRAHPSYDSQGGVPALSEIKFSVTHSRGCFGACSFCSLAFHQGRFVTSRSHASVIREIEEFTHDPDFKGYVHDIGGPTANFRHPSCKKQASCGLCADRQCLFPSPCPAIDASHSDYLKLLREASAVPGVKKVFIRSGLRFDYLLAGKNDEFLTELVANHVSGQLRVAPEHVSDRVLYYMGKPPISVYRKFEQRFYTETKKLGLKQYLVPYLISSHPGSTLDDAIELACMLNAAHITPEQVQDFYPTPGTLSTAMYYTGLDPRTMEPVFVPNDPAEKAMQRALLQWRKPENRRLVEKALHLAGREDLIGSRPGCLIPARRYNSSSDGKPQPQKRRSRNSGKKTK